MTARYALAWSAGASVGLAVGFFYGTVAQEWVAWRAVRPVERRNAPEAVDGRADEGTALCGDVDLWDGRTCTRPAGHGGDHMDGPNAAWWTTTPREDAR